MSKQSVLVSASMSCMDLSDLRAAVREVEESQVSFCHFDVVDGRFNQCFILGEATLENMKGITGIPIEAHLAVYDPELYIGRFARAGADYIAVHYEAMEDPGEIFAQIRQTGAKPVLAYRADTAPGEDFPELAAQVEWVLKLTVNPGFSGQKLQPQAVEHIRQMRQMADRAGLSVRIEADGNINSSTIRTVTEAGADILTGGSSGLFCKGGTVSRHCQEMLAAAGEQVVYQ